MPALRNIVQSCRRTARNRSCTRRYPTDTGFVTDTLAYTANSKTTSNARGGVRTEVVNGLGKLKTLTERTTGSATSVLTYEYDGFGNLTRTTDSGGNPTTITYDLLGRKKQLADKDLGTLNYTLDALGQTVTQTDAKGQLAAFEYDALRRLTKRTEAGVITGVWSFDTCQNGRLCTATAPNFSRTHAYDGVGRLTNTSSLNNGQSFASIRRYDSYGRLQAEVHTQGTRVPVVVGFGYNARLSLRENSLQNSHLGQTLEPQMLCAYTCDNLSANCSFFVFPPRINYRRAPSCRPCGFCARHRGSAFVCFASVWLFFAGATSPVAAEDKVIPCPVLTASGPLLGGPKVPPLATKPVATATTSQAAMSAPGIAAPSFYQTAGPSDLRVSPTIAAAEFSALSAEASPVATARAPLARGPIETRATAPSPTSPRIAVQCSP